MVVGSFSKAFAITGWRCGYLLTNASVIAEAMKIQDCMLICASVPVQRAVAAVLDVTPPIRCNGSASFEAGAMFWSTLRRIPAVAPVRPSGGFLLMARLDGVSDSKAAALALIEQQHVVTIPGVFFGRAGEATSGSRTARRHESASKRRARESPSFSSQLR